MGPKELKGIGKIQLNRLWVNNHNSTWNKRRVLEERLWYHSKPLEPKLGNYWSLPEESW